MAQAAKNKQLESSLSAAARSLRENEEHEAEARCTVRTSGCTTCTDGEQLLCLHGRVIGNEALPWPQGSRNSPLTEAADETSFSCLQKRHLQLPPLGMWPSVVGRSLSSLSRKNDRNGLKGSVPKLEDDLDSGFTWSEFLQSPTSSGGPDAPKANGETWWEVSRELLALGPTAQGEVDREALKGMEWGQLQERMREWLTTTETVLRLYQRLTEPPPTATCTDGFRRIPGCEEPCRGNVRRKLKFTSPRTTSSTSPASVDGSGVSASSVSPYSVEGGSAPSANVKAHPSPSATTGANPVVAELGPEDASTRFPGKGSLKERPGMEASGDGACDAEVAQAQDLASGCEGPNHADFPDGEVHGRSAAAHPRRSKSQNAARKNNKEGSAGDIGLHPQHQTKFCSRARVQSDEEVAGPWGGRTGAAADGCELRGKQGSGIHKASPGHEGGYAREQRKGLKRQGSEKSRAHRRRLSLENMSQFEREDSLAAEQPSLLCKPQREGTARPRGAQGVPGPFELYRVRTDGDRGWRARARGQQAMASPRQESQSREGGSGAHRQGGSRRRGNQQEGVKKGRAALRLGAGTEEGQAHGAVDLTREDAIAAMVGERQDSVGPLLVRRATRPAFNRTRVKSLSSVAETRSPSFSAPVLDAGASAADLGFGDEDGVLGARAELAEVARLRLPKSASAQAQTASWHFAKALSLNEGSRRKKFSTYKLEFSSTLPLERRPQGAAGNNGEASGTMKGRDTAQASSAVFLAKCGFPSVLDSLSCSGVALAEAPCPVPGRQQLLLEMYSWAMKCQAMAKDVLWVARHGVARERWQQELPHALAQSFAASFGAFLKAVESKATLGYAGGGWLGQLLRHLPWWRTTGDQEDALLRHLEGQGGEGAEGQVTRRVSGALTRANGNLPFVTNCLAHMLDLATRHKDTCNALLQVHFFLVHQRQLQGSQRSVTRAPKSLALEVPRAVGLLWGVVTAEAEREPVPVQRHLILLNNAIKMAKLETAADVPIIRRMFPRRKITLLCEDLSSAALQDVLQSVRIPANAGALNRKEIERRLAKFNRSLDELALIQQSFQLESEECKTRIRRMWATDVCAAYKEFLTRCRVHRASYKSYQWELQDVRKLILKTFLVSNKQHSENTT